VAGVPMAVPVSCSQCVSPNIKMLLFITISRIDRKNSVGNDGGMDSLCVSKRILKIVIPVSTSMFVYIAVASAVNSFAPVVSNISDLESFIYDGIKCNRLLLKKLTSA
jgi:hypothetical protein